MSRVLIPNILNFFFNAILRTVHSVYNAHGIPVKQVVVDSDPAFVPVISMLAKVGILMTLVNPGQYCQRMEISIQSQDNRCAAVLASLPYVLPAEFHPWARKWVMDCSNNLSNSKTFPTSPRRLVLGTDLPLFVFKFGDVCMVRQYLAKRVQQSKIHGTSMDVEPKAELGVCFGYSSDHPGARLYLLENGKIVPRNAIALVQVVPFNFLPKKVLRAQLSLPVVDSPVVFQSSIQKSTEAISAPQSIQFGSFPSDSLDATVSLPGPPLDSVPASIVPSVSLPDVVNENFFSPLRVSRSPSLNSAIVPLRLMLSPDRTIVNSAPHTVVPSAIEPFIASSLPAVPVLRRSARHAPSGLIASIPISSTSDKSTYILRSLNLMRSPNGTIVLSPSAPEFIPRSVPSVLSGPKLIQNVDGTIGLASSVLPVLPVLKLIQPASRAIVDSSVSVPKSKVLLSSSCPKFAQHVDGSIGLASSVSQRSLRNVVDINGWTTVGRSESSVVFPRVITEGSLPVIVSPSPLLSVSIPFQQPKRRASK